jgi:hypothetical protein
MSHIQRVPEVSTLILTNNRTRRKQHFYVLFFWHFTPEEILWKVLTNL